MTLTEPALAYFQDEIDHVDSTKQLSYELDTIDLSPFEWFYQGLHVTGGSTLAVEHGLSSLLHEMGFAWYAPFDPAIGSPAVTRPPEIELGLKCNRTRNYLPNMTFLPSYDVAGWGGPFLADRVALREQHHRWSVLNAVESTRFRYVSGHRWQAVVLADPSYWAANEHLLLPGDTSNSRRFDLDGMDSDASDARWNECVHACAAYLLASGVNAHRRTHFDPTDGNPHGTELVCRFTRDVCEAVRRGTKAIGRYCAMPGVPGAVLGILAYSNHALAPAGDYSDQIHVQITTAYRSTSIAEGFDAWSPRSESVSLYDYWDLPIWYHCMPISDRANKSNHLTETLQPVLERGVVALGAESSANWLACMVLHHQMITYARTGRTSFLGSMERVVDDVFDGDANVHALLSLWSDTGTFLHWWTLAESFAHVRAMPTGSWYRDAFSHILVVVSEYLELINLRERHPEIQWLGGRIPIADTNAAGYDSASDPARKLLKQLFGHTHAIRMDNTFHSWGMQSVVVNSGLIRDHYPEIYLSGPDPEWMRPPYDARPTDIDFSTCEAFVNANAPAPSVGVAPRADDSDLVLLGGLSAWPNTPTRSDFVRLQHSPANAWAQLKYVVPAGATGQVTISNSLETSTRHFGEGTHDLDAGRGDTIRYTTGSLFLAGFPPVSTEVNGGEFYWIFVPESAADQTLIHTTGAFTCRSVGTGLVTTFGESDNAIPKKLGSGQVAVLRQATRGLHTLLTGVGQWFSLDASVALVPRWVAVEAIAANPALSLTELPITP